MNMKSQNLIILISLFVFLISCRKDGQKKNDFRANYIGEYELYVHSHHWQYNAYDYWTEDTIVGEVFIYDSTQSYSYLQNTFYPFTEEEISNALTIRFTEFYHSYCYLQEDDTIRSAGGYHYSHSGYFTGDSLYFNVVGLGGLGGGSDYYTRGKKL